MEWSKRESLNVRMRLGDDDETPKAQTWATVRSIMCARNCPTDEDNTNKEETLPNKQAQALTSLQLLFSWVFTCFRFASTPEKLSCLLLWAFVSSFQHFDLTFMWIPRNYSHCENESSEVMSLVHTDHDAWHIVPTDNRREIKRRTSSLEKKLAHTTSVVSVLNSVLQRHESCGHYHPCWRTCLTRVHTAPGALSACTTVFLVHGDWHFGIVVNRKSHSIKCIVANKSIFVHVAARKWRCNKPTRASHQSTEIWTTHGHRRCLIIFNPKTFVLHRWKQFIANVFEVLSLWQFQE